MARLLSVRTLSGAPSRAASLLLSCCRRLSGLPERTQLVGLELEAEGGSAPPAEIEILGLSRRLEDAIYAIIVRRSAPDWLPFAPGTSYWVPPRKGGAYGVAELLSTLANPMTAEEIMSFTSVRGWPSLSFFVEGTSPWPLMMTQERTDADDNENY